MKSTNIFSIFVAMVGVLISSTAAEAQAFQPPAELPPSGFTGAQYADSNGCIYIRAGVSGAVSWVPRVTRDRRQICGFEPSFPGRSAAAPAVAASAVKVLEAEPDTLSPDTRILPKHLFDLRKSQRPVKTPKGYRSAWQDGRLNLRRAEGTLRGREKMNKIWTNTVPRRLILPE